LFTLAAQVTTLPVIALQFNRLSLTSLISNPLVLPVQPAILVAGGITTMIGMVIHPVGRVLAAVTWPLLAYSNRVVAALAKLKWGAITLSSTAAIWISVLLVLILLLILFRNYFKKLFKTIRWFYLIVFLALVTSLLWTIVLRGADGSLHLSLIRSGDGSSIFVKSPNGTTLLIDPDGSANQLAAQASQWVSPWRFHVDAALFTNVVPARTISEVNARLPVDLAILAPAVYQLSEETRPVTLPQGMPIKKLREGETIQIEDGFTIQPVASDLERTALLLTYGETRILIPGGADPAALAAQRSTNLSGLSILILNEADIENLPADMWQNFGAQVILWNSPSVSPDPEWVGLDRQDQIIIQSDGLHFSIE